MTYIPDPIELMEAAAEREAFRTSEAAVLLDSLCAAGYARISLWHLDVLRAWLAQVEVTGKTRLGQDYDTPAEKVETRLRSDLFDGPLDALHVLAQWEDAERTARGPRTRSVDLVGPRLGDGP